MADLSAYSDEELMAIAGIAPQPADKDTSFLESMALGAKKRAAGVGELGLKVAGTLGADVAPYREDLANLQQLYEQQGQGTGAKGFIGEALGDPLTYLPGSSLKALAGMGAVSGLTTGTGDANSDLLANAENAALQAGTGVAAGLVGKQIPKVTKGISTIYKGATARGEEALGKALGGMQDEANSLYRAMRESGAVINKPRAVNIVNKATEAMKKTGKINKRLHGDTLSVLNDFKKAVKSNQIGLEELDQFRQLFADVVSKNTEMTGKMNPDALMAKRVINSIDDSVNDLAAIDIKGGNIKAIDTLKQARSQYSKMRKFETITNILQKSEGDANYVKRELTKLVNNPKKTRGWNKDELLALKDAAKLSGGEAVLKIAGKFGFDPSRLGSGVGALFGSSAGALAGGATGGVAVPAIGTGARYAQKGLVRGKAENLLKTIESGIAAPDIIPEFSGAVPSQILGRPAIQGTMQGQGVNQPVTQEQPSSQLENMSEEELMNIINQGQQSSLLDRISQAESGGRPMASNPKSTAEGLFQFTDKTWNSMVRKYGEQNGITKQDKLNPAAQRVMAGILTQENNRIVSKALGRQLDDGDLYVAHVLGAGDAARVLKAYDKGKDVKATSLVSSGVPAANRAIFYDGNRPRSVKEVVAILKARV